MGNPRPRVAGARKCRHRKTGRRVQGLAVALWPAYTRKRQLVYRIAALDTAGTVPETLARPEGNESCTRSTARTARKHSR